MEDPFVEAIRMLAEGTVKGDRALLTVIEAIIERLNNMQEQIDMLSALLLTKKEG